MQNSFPGRFYTSQTPATQANSLAPVVLSAASYWESLEAIKNWKANMEHLEAQEKGKTTWYKNYKVRIAKVEREYEF